MHRARPGDVLRLGPPAGSMTVDHTTDNGLLCLGGGTGIAPIKALVEDVAEHGERRPVEVFYGARSDHDLYDIDTMLRLAADATPGSRSGPVVGRAGSRQLPDAVRRVRPVERVRRVSLRPARDDPQRCGRAAGASASRATGYGTTRSKSCVAAGDWPRAAGLRAPGGRGCQPRSGACMARTPSMLPSR